jgi:hypothetical protein
MPVIKALPGCVLIALSTCWRKFFQSTHQRFTASRGCFETLDTCDCLIFVEAITGVRVGGGRSFGYDKEEHKGTHVLVRRCQQRCGVFSAAGISTSSFLDTLLPSLPVTRGKHAKRTSVSHLTIWQADCQMGHACACQTHKRVPSDNLAGRLSDGTRLSRHIFSSWTPITAISSSSFQRYTACMSLRKLRI